MKWIKTMQGTAISSRGGLFPGAKLAEIVTISSDSSLEVEAFVNKWKSWSFGARIEDDITLTSEDTVNS